MSERGKTIIRKWNLNLALLTGINYQSYNKILWLTGNSTIYAEENLID